MKLVHFKFIVGGFVLAGMGLMMIAFGASWGELSAIVYGLVLLVFGTGLSIYTYRRAQQSK